VIGYLFIENYQLKYEIELLKLNNNDSIMESIKVDTVSVPEPVKETINFNTEFTNGSEEYEDSEMPDDLYEDKVKQIKYLLSNKFSSNQLGYIHQIHLINWDDLNDDCLGITSYDGETNEIYLPIDNNKYCESLLHEVWHCIMNKNEKLFSKYQLQWLGINRYVSDYAATDVDEDLAETGMVFSLGRKSTNPKIKIISEIYKKTY
jgi:hypothetical protein